MRITQEQKAKNRKRILQVAQQLFSQGGYEQTTTRDISKACDMAKGTLFNYFKSKETLAITMVAEALADGQALYLKRKSGTEELPEELFLLIASELRSLRPFRNYIGPVLESGMSVFAKSSPSGIGESLRQSHLLIVSEIMANHGYDFSNHSIPVTLYWSLYLGILAYWSKDISINQTETLTLVDYSMQMFITTISGQVLPLTQAVANE